MKKIIAVVVFVILMIQYGFADDTTKLGKRLDTLSIKVDSIKKSFDTLKIEMSNAVKADTSKNECNCVPFTKFEPIGTWKISLIASPFLLLILVVMLIAIQLWKFKFKEALTENEPPKKVIKNPEYNAEVIAANAGIPNLSILFPTTIEISNIEPSLSDLREIATSKDAAVTAAKISFDTAHKNKPNLDKAVNDAQTAFDAATNASTASEQAAKDANTLLKALNDARSQDTQAIELAKTTLATANQAVATNKTLLTNATNDLDLAKKAVKSNSQVITDFPELDTRLKTEAASAKDNLSKALAAAQSGAAYSINTYRPSISRYIAFISSLVIILIAVCMSSFFIYHYIRTGCPPEFGALTGMLIVLGLGVTPYITNKISTAATTNKP